MASQALPDGSAPAALAVLQERAARAPFEASRQVRLAEALAASGRRAEADTLMERVGALGRRDPMVQAWLLNADLRAGRFDSAFGHADALMRRPGQDAFRIRAVERLTAAAANPAAVGALARRLAGRPWWREAFLRDLGRAPATRDDAVRLLTRLRAGPAPPSAPEAAAPVISLLAEARYGEAYAVWFAASPLAGARVRGFAARGDGTPFTWELSAGEGSTSIAPIGDGRIGLRAQYDGVGDPARARQLLVLGPGAWRLTWNEMSETPPAGFAWTLTCVGEAAPLLQAVSPAAQARRWSAGSAEFEVPAVHCPAVWLTLDPIADARARAVVEWRDSPVILSSSSPPS